VGINNRGILRPRSGLAPTQRTSVG
jgi:hypothetical protein